jgi:hypothetical protein
MTRVEYRLAAARYFLKLLVDQRPRPPVFDWFLEAFITTARTVRWIMRAEVHNSPLMEEWERTLQRDAATAALLKKMNEIRIRVTKQEPLGTLMTATLGVPKSADALAAKLQSGELGVGSEFHLLTAPDGTRFIATKHGTVLAKADTFSSHQVLSDFPAEDILNVCTRYVEFLEREYADWRRFCTARSGPPAEEFLRGRD